MHGGVYYVYWFCPQPNGDRFSVRQRLCADCFAINVEAMLTPLDVDDLTCSACGISVESDVYPMYATWSTKGQDKTRGQMALCEDHQLELKARASKNSLVLEDRYINGPDIAVARGAPSTDAVYQALGRLDPGTRRA